MDKLTNYGRQILISISFEPTLLLD